MIWRTYKLPYVYDADAWTAKYVGIEFAERHLTWVTLEDLRPDQDAGVFAVKGTEDDHAWLSAFSDAETQ